MEWVETTGKTLEEAKDLALDELGVDEEDAEFEILEEPRTGLFGRTRGEARVRARVRPTVPRAKADRRDRRRRKADAPKGADDSSSDTGGDHDTADADADAPAKPARSRSKAKAKAKAKAKPAASSEPADDTADAGDVDGGVADTTEAPATKPRRRKATPAAAPAAQTPAEPRRRAGREEGNDMSGDATVEQQAAIITTFLDGLVDAFGYDATVSEERIDDETIELQVNGTDLGLLVGPKGQTLQAIQELSRTVVQRQATGTHHGRVRLDVAGYRSRRREALERFTRQVAESVLAEGVAKALEPMHPADRKVVHDTVNEIDGVHTISEGEDHRRRVVILPDTPAGNDED